MLSDTHTHTRYSADSKSEPEDNIRKAVENGQKCIVLTDHYDFGVKYGDNEYDFDALARAAEIQLLREKYKDQITVLCGIEVGQQPIDEVKAENERKLSEYPYDFVIGSTHIIEGEDPYMRKFFEGKTKNEAYTILLEELIANMRFADSFDSVGHFDYTSRYAPYDDRTLRFRDFPDMIDTFLKLVIKKGKALEFNTKTSSRAEVDPEIWKRYKYLGGELVTIGSDAHKPELVGLEFQKCAGFLKSCGFGYTFVYKGRKPEAEKID